MVNILIQLPGGDWVAAGDVRQVSAVCPAPGGGEGATVAVDMRDGRVWAQGYPDRDSAGAARDLLAATVNAAAVETAGRLGDGGLRRENERLRCLLVDARAALLHGSTVESRHAAWKAIGKALTEGGVV